MQNSSRFERMEAGRILVDYSVLDRYAQRYKRKVLDLITLCYNKVVVFDFDGTLTNFKYDTDRLMPCKDDDINEYFATHNFYQNCEIIETMRFVVTHHHCKWWLLEYENQLVLEVVDSH